MDDIKNLLMDRKNGAERVSAEVLAAADEYAEGYKAFLDEGKTEREAAAAAVRMAEEAGYVRLTPNAAILPGAKFYDVAFGKLVMLAHIGNKPLDGGLNISAAHIDSPRIDLKPNPLAEDSGFAMFRTHYYGGIRKYQWLSLPLELHGVVCREDGEKVEVALGADEDDPVLVINDLLPHLDRGDKNISKISGELLDPIIGSVPYEETEDIKKDRVKLAVMSLLNDKYGMTEYDFTTSELSLVPALRARDVGIDRSMIGAYGQDDRVCGYAALRAMLAMTETPERTAVCILADKEEIGSEGTTGMKSALFDRFCGRLCRGQDVQLDDCLANSFCISADVTAAFDPNYPEAFEKSNASLLGNGPAVCKYTGSGGKGGASDAHAETVAALRTALDADEVIWQICELGKVDVGGGGTVCKYIAERGVESVDIGTPVLGMHSPYEVTSKLDCYMTMKANEAFFKMK